MWFPKICMLRIFPYVSRFLPGGNHTLAFDTNVVIPSSMCKLDRYLTKNKTLRRIFHRWRRIFLTLRDLKIKQSHKFHNASVPYPKMHHSEQKCASVYISVLNGVLWDMGQMLHCEICEFGQLAIMHPKKSIKLATTSAHRTMIHVSKSDSWRSTTGSEWYSKY